VLSCVVCELVLDEMDFCAAKAGVQNYRGNNGALLCFV